MKSTRNDARINPTEDRHASLRKGNTGPMPPRPRTPTMRTVALGVALTAGMFYATAARAQAQESDPSPALGKFEPEPLPPPKEPYLIPDVPESIAEQAQVREPWVTLKGGLVLIADYTAFNQNSKSVSQVGTQKDQWDCRSARLMLHGTFGRDYKVGYLVAGEYKGFESDPETTWQLTDLSLTFPLGSPASKLTVGKTKETFAYEMVGDAASLPQPERVLNPFFVSRDIGLKFTQVIGDTQWMTASVGVFNDWFVGDQSLNKNGTDVTARVTGLVWDQSDGTSFLHLGISGRYAGSDNKTLRYRGRPESNVSDNFVDTGNFAGDYAFHLGLEALWNQGPFSLLAEYNHAWVESPATGYPEFNGFYLTGSWILTGETRPYDRTTGYARRIIPAGTWGAPELVARFSMVDLDDGAVRGGTFYKTYLGINWWATRRWKLGFGWNHTWLDRFGTTGETDSFLFRIQWIF
jgi:phosphate-selective porin OprO and OprP